MTPKQWDAHYLQHDRFRMQPNPGLAKFITLLKHRAFKKVIDLGCGSGNEILELAENGFNVLGLDFSPAAVDLAQKRLMDKGLPGRAAIADLHEEIKAVEDGSYEGCVAIDSLQYKTETEFRNTLKEIRRILGTKGVMLLVVPSKEVKRSGEHTGINFKEADLENELKKHFKIISFEPDTDGNFVIMAEEMS